MPPASVAGVLAALDVMQDEPERRERLWEQHATAWPKDFARSASTSARRKRRSFRWSSATRFERWSMWRALFDDGVFTHPDRSARRARARVPHSRFDVRRALGEQIERVLAAFERVGREMAIHSMAS